MFRNPVLLFSGGKDSLCVAHLARKAFWPASIPFPLMHVDTGHNFPETLAFRDAFVSELGTRLIVASVQDTIDRGRVVEERGLNPSRNSLQTVTLLDAINAHRFDAAIGGARRDDENNRVIQAASYPTGRSTDERNTDDIPLRHAGSVLSGKVRLVYWLLPDDSRRGESAAWSPGSGPLKYACINISITVIDPLVVGMSRRCPAPVCLK
jgi:3'-phosphoadenosine 5'-phosphosulfate sulfotransferase (PAPS reductase)/FAD synthetase